MATRPWKRIGADEAKDFARYTLLDPSRGFPVVAVTTSVGQGRPWIDPEALTADLEGRAQVVLLETGEATWALGAALPPRLDVFGGAARIWWPGLQAQSDPFDHVLLLIYNERDAARARERILAAVRGGDPSASRWGEWRASGDAAVPAPRPARPLAPPRPASPAPARPAAKEPAEPDPWQRIADEYKVGEVVPGRVFRLDPRFVLVELLPQAGIMVPLAEIDYTWVRDPAEILTVGERVNVKLLELDPPARRGLASIKRGLSEPARAGIGLHPGGEPYFGPESEEESDAHVRRALQRERAVHQKQEEELQAAVEDRNHLAKRCEDLKQQAASARKELRSAQDRIGVLEARIAGLLDPLASENAFLAAVRVEYARRWDESDRFRYPLAKMRVGRTFLESLRSLEGIEIEKVVEVCAQVASGRAHEFPGRAVHELGEGSMSRSTVRASDNARAWRCALQVGSPSARRLHWWSIPQPGGGASIEFANVAVHDEFSIPG